MNPIRAGLTACLVALVVLYLLWFHGTGLALVLFALPPAVLALLLWLGRKRTALVAGIVAMAWFAHGVMVVWTRPPERLFALIELALALAVVGLVGLPGLRARKLAKQQK